MRAVRIGLAGRACVAGCLDPGLCRDDGTVPSIHDFEGVAEADAAAIDDAGVNTEIAVA